jgi:DNA-binding NarL/FixJ family response regulator
MSKRGRPRHPDVLTPRQREVLEHVREGKTNQQIAREIASARTA